MTKPHDPTQVNEARRFRSLLLGLVALTFAVHFASNFGGALILDDRPNLSENPGVTQFTPWSPGAWWRAAFESPARLRPLPYLTFAAQWWAHGENLPALHLVNSALHALAALALALLLLELPATPGAGPVRGRDRALPAVAAAALWALHPIQTQAVTYLVQRMTVLCGLFSLLALWRYVRGVRTGSRRDFCWSGVFYLLALLSKESAAMLPLVGLLYEWIVADPSVRLGERRRRRIALVLALLPPLAMAGIYAALSDQHFAAGALPGRDFTVWERLLSAPRIYFKGIFALLWPAGLALEHGMQVSRGFFEPASTAIGWAGLLLLTGATIRTRREHRRTAWAILSFLVLQLPENSFLNLELFFEHRLYLPGAFVIPLLPVALARLVAGKNELRPYVTAALTLLLIAGAGLTIRRNLLWHDPVALLKDNVALTPRNARLRYNLGREFERAGDLKAALGYYHDADRLGYAEGAFATATTAHRLGRIALAKKEYHNALGKHPRPAEVWVNLGLLYKGEGNTREARRAYEHALDFAPEHPDALLNLGGLELAAGRSEEAEALFTRSLQARPNQPKAHYGRMMARINLRKKELARADYEKALELGFDGARSYAPYFGE